MIRSVLRRLATIIHRFPRLEQRLWARWYRYFDRLLGERPVWFLNYGLIPPDGEAPSLRPEDEENRESIQLYHRVAGAIELRDLSVLEVSCGRGGGAQYLKEYLGARPVIGLDRTEGSLEFCHARRHDRVDGLICGDALALPFSDASFDALVNVEASHCYPDFGRFLSEAKRVLRPGGWLLYADMRRKSACDAWRTALVDSGFEISEEEDITKYVAQALTATTEQRESLIGKKPPRFLRRFLRAFAGTKGTATYRALQTGDLRYVRFVLRP